MQSDTSSVRHDGTCIWAVYSPPFLVAKYDTTLFTVQLGTTQHETRYDIGGLILHDFQVHVVFM